MERLRSIFFCLLVLFSGLANAASTASFELSTSTLTLPTVKLDSSTTFQNVVLRLLSIGRLGANDTSVGSEIEFESRTNTLRIPTLTVGSASYSRISLTGAGFALVSVGGVVADAGTSGRYNLDITVTAAGVSVPPIRIANVPRPSGQSDFCVPDIYNQFQQNLQGVAGSWSITSCSFNGTTGQIAAQLTITSPVTFSFAYSVTYTYTPI